MRNGRPHCYPLTIQDGSYFRASRFLLTKKRRRSGKLGHPGKPLTPMDEPNAVWTVDFKGQFKMRNGRYCYPLTIQDGFSRFLLE